MQVVIRCGLRYTQRELDKAIDAALRDDRARRGLDREIEQTVRDARVTAAEMKAAWQRYVHLFGGPPHGTEKQLAALLELVPARVRPR